MGFKHIAFRMTCLLLSAQMTVSHAQYYFNDLYMKERMENRQSMYKKLRVKRINETAILPTGERQPDVLQWTEISKNGDTATHHRSVEGSVSKSVLLYDQGTGNLLNQLETEADRRNETTYTYNSLGQIERTETFYIDSEMNFNDHEIHIWKFEKENRPKYMWRIVKQSDGNMDSTFIEFTTDANGRVIEENTYRKSKKTGFYYYYYDDKGQLTDVVRYNEKWKRLLPDIMLEYDLEGNIIQKRQLVGNREISYLLWRYTYDSIGLQVEEALYNNKKEHSGSFRFTFEFYK